MIQNTEILHFDDHWEIMMWLEEQQQREEQQQLDEDEEIELQRASQREAIESAIRETL
jgi:hypothetical protein